MSEYVGRFAPSPTGPLHFGSLVAAVASYCEAKSAQGKWLVRIEDVDKPREVNGAAQHILNTLDSFGFCWDGDILYPSQQTAYYEQALLQLQQTGMVYACTCSRKEIADSSTLHGVEGVIYPGTCLTKPVKPNAPVAWRIKTEAFIGHFNDAIQGDISQDLAKDIGDFVLKRADGLFAYQLAVVVDDAMQGINHSVRGADLLMSTPRQVYLQHLLGLPNIHYTHIPIVKNADGEKLSKQTLAPALQQQQASQLIYDALIFLNHAPPASFNRASLSDIWDWAIANWRTTNLRTS